MNLANARGTSDTVANISGQVVVGMQDFAAEARLETWLRVQVAFDNGTEQLCAACAEVAQVDDFGYRELSVPC